MKRWFTAALAFVMTLSSTPAGLMAARAEEAGIEAFVPPAEETGAEGLTIGGDDWTEETANAAPAQVLTDATAPAYNGSGQYASVTAKHAALRESPKGAELGAIEKGGTVLVLDRKGDYIKVAFNTYGGIVTAWAAAADLSLLDDQQTAAFLDALAASGAVALYEGDLERPLQTLSFIAGEQGETIEAEALEAELASTVKPTGIRLNASSGTLGVGEFFTGLKATVSPSNASTEITWSSSNKKVIEVDSYTGELFTLKTGTATITAKTSNGKKASCKIKVKKAPASITVSPAAMALERGDRGALKLKFSSGSGCGTVSFTSSDKSVATVNVNGVVTAVGGGTAVITATTYNGESDSCVVSVEGESGELELNQTASMLAVGEIYKGLKAILYTDDGNINYAPNVTWSTSNSKIVAVKKSSGAVKGIKTGTATITARTSNGLTASCRITVKKAPAGFTIEPAALKLDSGERYELGIVLPGNTGLAGLSFKSSDPGVATVDSDGIVTAIGAGRATITAKSYNGKSATCSVTVAGAAALSLPASFSMRVGDTREALEAMLTYSNGVTALATGLTWSSGNKNVVTVDASTGRLSARGKGTATITARTADGLKDTCKITVSAASSGLTLSPSSVKLSAGGMKFQMSAKTSGSSTADVRYASSDTGVAKVNSKGVITTVGAGKATITATANGQSDTCAVTVTGVPVKASFGTTKVTLSTDECIVPDVKVQAADGSEAVADLNFRILAGPQYISLNSATGEITALEAGTAVVGVSTHNGVDSSNTYTVTVVDEVTGISLDRTTLSMGAGDITQLEARVSATKGANTSVTWSTSNKKVAKVSAGGIVTAVAAGSAAITASTSNGMKATCRVTVHNPATSISLSPANGAIYCGEAGRYVVKASGGSVGDISFISSNPDIAEVDDDGIVVGIYPGTVTITAVAENGALATAKLTVKRRSTSRDDDEGYESGDYGYNDTIEEVIALAESQLGKRYVSKGGYKDSNPSGFDCSGLVYWCYYQVGIKLGDSPSRQASDSKYTKITSISDLQRGDVVCFKSDSSSSVSHTGIYRGNGEFIHASSAGGAVIITDIHKDYYTRNFVGARRIID